MNNLAKFTQGELLKLVEEKWIGRVTAQIIAAIEMSFRTDDIIRPVQTREEIERRFEICIKWFITLRRDFHWTVPRILDEMYPALRATLNDTEYVPSDKDSWITK